MTKTTKKYATGVMLLILFLDLHFPHLAWAQTDIQEVHLGEKREEILIPMESETISISSKGGEVSVEIPILIRPLTEKERRLISELDPYKKESNLKQEKRKEKQLVKKQIVHLKGKSSDSRLTITAYSSTVDQTDATPCTTANGFDVCSHNTEDIIATNMLPFGTKVRIPELYGDRVFVVQDRMHPRYSQRVDVWMKSRGEAKKFGVKRAHIEVVHDELAMK